MMFRCLNASQDFAQPFHDGKKLFKTIKEAIANQADGAAPGGEDEIYVFADADNNDFFWNSSGEGYPIADFYLVDFEIINDIASCGTIEYVERSAQ